MSDTSTDRRSLLGKAWKVPPPSAHPTIRAALLAHYGVADSPAFFAPSLARDGHDPFLLTQMAHAVERIHVAVAATEPIAIFGDYDVDGLTGTALLADALKHLGGKVATMIPNRLTEGYGLSAAAVAAAADAGVRVLITVDCGVSNAGEISGANARGIDVIVCDHHEFPPELPSDAFALLHPRIPGETYPFPHLTGAGVAWKLAQALRGDDGAALLDFAALGTLADQGALSGENRMIVRVGLEQLARRARPGLRALIDVSKIEGAALTEEHVHFQLAPRLNAAGRMAHPEIALRLLRAQDAREATALAAELEQLNLARRRRTEELFVEILQRLDRSAPHGAVVLRDPTWSVGLLGLLCSRVVERTGLPTVLLEDRGELLTGSARSIPGFDVHAALAASRHHFLKFGGHAQAAGFSMRATEFDAFRTEFQTTCARAPTRGDDLVLTTRVDAAELTAHAARDLRSFAPFGPGLEAPTFYLGGVTLDEVRPMGDGSHLRLQVRAGDRSVTLTAFRFGKYLSQLPVGGRIDAALRMGLSTWRSQERLELHVVDMRLTR